MTRATPISTAERRELEERIIWELGPSAMCVGKLSAQLGILPEVVSRVVDARVELFRGGLVRRIPAVTNSVFFWWSREPSPADARRLWLAVKRTISRP